MSATPFGRVIINPREKPLSSDINRISSYAHETLVNLARRLLAGRSSASSEVDTDYPGFIGNAFKVRPGTGLTVTLDPGLGFLSNTGLEVTDADGVIGIDDEGKLSPIVLSQLLTLNVPAAPTAGQNRVDIIEVKLDRRSENAQTRKVLNPDTGVFEAQQVFKTYAYDLYTRSGFVNSPTDSTVALSYKKGVAATAGSETVPATSSGYKKVAEIQVNGAASSIALNRIVDCRQLMFPGGVTHTMADVHVSNTTAGPDGSFDGFEAPPGIEACVNRGSAVPSMLWNVYYKLGDADAYVHRSLAHFKLAYSSTSHPGTHHAQVLATDVVTVDGTLQTNLADATKTWPAMAVAVGQKLLRVGMQILKVYYDSGTTALATETTETISTSVLLNTAIRRKQ